MKQNQAAFLHKHTEKVIVGVLTFEEIKRLPNSTQKPSIAKQW